MKDFDQFFRDRLDGERPFARRDENWRQLSRRLEAFDSGVQDAQPATPVRRWTNLAWKMAACAAAATAIWVGIQNYSLRRQNEALNDQLTQIKAHPTNDQKTTAPLNTSIETASASGADTPEFLYSSATQPASLSFADGNEPPTNGSNNYVKDQRASWPAGPSQPSTGIAKNKANPEQKDAVADQTAEESNATNPKLVQEIDTTPEHIGWKKLQQPDSISSRPVLAQLTSLDNNPPKLPALSLRTKKEPTTAQPVIQPVKQTSRMRVGIQAVAGTAVPAESGVSWFRGQALTAEFRVWNRIWLGASADFVQYDIDTDNNPDRFHLPEQIDPDPPGGPISHHQYDLKGLRTEQRQRRFAAGVRYELPVRGRITPSVQVGYVWTQLPDSYVQYEFKKKPHGGGGPPNPNDPFDNKIFIRKTDSHWEKNIWRFGAGADYPVGRWSLGLAAHYDKHFTGNDPLFDALSFKLGASYQF